ncbi:hypothetical protein [Amaricoccus sp.]|uniref:hypothetical protein n=1 Tax=Amaricoccus sp. TaxID=1872485 RepID=UPI001B3FE001|nr:hypothetical protein [Amaricoccus sp.]MBP7242910.1 hypothetical protein [Amaricoccus sp.]
MPRLASAAACLAACFALSGPGLAQTAALPGPIAAFAAERSAECTELGGTPRVGPAFATPVDLTGDGTPDYVVDLAGMECANAWSAFCGSAGCPVSVWLAGPEGLRQEWSDYAQGWSIVAVGAEAGLTVERHGAACPGAASGAETCSERLSFAGAPAAPAPTPQAPAEATAADAVASPVAEAAAMGAPAAEGWTVRQMADGSQVAVAAAPGAFSTIAVFCLSGQPWLAASLDEPIAAETAQVEFTASGATISSPARREAGAGGALVIELAERPLLDLLLERSRTDVRLDGVAQGTLSLRGSTRAIRAALAPCLR